MLDRGRAAAKPETGMRSPRLPVFAAFGHLDGGILPRSPSRVFVSVWETGVRIAGQTTVHAMRNRDIRRDWVTTREAARKLGLDPRTIMRACRRGVLPGAELLGMGWVIPRASLDAARSTLRGELAKRTEKGRLRQRRQPFLRGAAPTAA